MAVYWISFRIHNDAGYEKTYEKLTTEINKAVDTTTMWVQTSSFYLAESDWNIDQIAHTIKGAIRVDRDIAVVGMTDFKRGRVIGHCTDQDIFELVPFMKKV